MTRNYLIDMPSKHDEFACSHGITLYEEGMWAEGLVDELYGLEEDYVYHWHEDKAPIVDIKALAVLRRVQEAVINKLNERFAYFEDHPEWLNRCFWDPEEEVELVWP